MEYVCNYMAAEIHPGEWAKRREDQGWPILSVADHFLTSTRGFPHVWVSASAMAMATDHATITTAFVNNLFRSPVEVAQAALAMSAVAGGRFELGLGAGWARHEMQAAGLEYPPPGERAGAYAEAVQIVRSILETGACQFVGDHYRIDIEGLAPLPAVRIPLVGSVGGPRTIREVTPHCDRVELKAASPATRDGGLDFGALAAIDDAHLVDLINRARSARPDIELGVFVLCNVVDDDHTRGLSAALGDGLYSRFFGTVGHVIEGLEWLESLGITRVQLSPIDDTSLDRLAASLFK